MKYYIALFSCLSLLYSCQKNDPKKVDLSQIEINFEFVDFHNSYYNSNETEFEKLKSKLPYLFPKNIHDSIWKAKRTNPEELYLHKKVDSVFGNLKEEKTKLNKLFKTFKYYEPNFKAPKTISLITNLDYNNKVVYVDSLLFISLDMYLGNNCDVYTSFPKYISQKHNKEYLFVDITKTISSHYFNIPNGSTFLDNIINKGKELYLIETLLQGISEQSLTGYSKEKLLWAKENEAFIWSYFIENKVLFSTDKKLSNRFINEAPFSKFYLDFDAHTPGQIGNWIGWKIVCSYAEKNKTNLLSLLKTDSETIFRKSKYKPIK